MFDVNHNSYAVYSMSDWLGSRSDLTGTADDAQYDGSMPSPNVANPKKTTPEKKGVELGQKLARRRSQDLAAKIQGWNASGAGNAQQQHEVVVLEEAKVDSKKHGDYVEVIVEATASGGRGAVVVEDEDGKEVRHEDSNEDIWLTPGTSAKGTYNMVTSTHTAREVDLERKAWVRRKSRPQVEVPDDVKQATTPKKRVVSDGHWRRDRLPAKSEPVTPERETQDTPPKPVTIKRSVVNVGLRVPPSVQDFIEEQQAPIRVRPLRSARERSRSKSRERGATPDYEDSGVKVYVKRRRRSRTAYEEETSGSSFVAGTISSADKQSSATDMTTPPLSPSKDRASRPNITSRFPSSRRLLGTDDEPSPQERRRSKTPVKDEAPPRSTPKPIDKPAIRPAAPVVPQIFGNRIEGWLAGTQDPFTEERNASFTPESLDRRQQKSRRKLDDKPKDDEDERIRGSSGTQRRSKPSLERISSGKRDSSSDGPPSATPTLRRRGAKSEARSPVKGRIESRTPSPTADYELSSRTVSDASLKYGTSRQDRTKPSPTTGKYLSTIASAETLSSRPPGALSETSDHPTVMPEGTIVSHTSDGDVSRRHTSLKRKLTRTSDLISVLSMSQQENPGLKSARSIRTRRVHPESATTSDLMNEVTTDELKYQRELRTMVDGVIPVLLTHVLQKNDATGKKRLFSGSSSDGQAVTKPIVAMGVALERLKAAHKRIPLHGSDDLLKWAEGAAKAYGEYLKVWTLGFHDIVVNLAPADENESMPKAGIGKLADRGDGERVDVAYLLKRPLVRLKHLTKTFRGINQIKPSTLAEDMGKRYHGLVEVARQRSNDERARLEDEAAASIDPTRARDPRSLAPLAGVSIDSTRSVRARDEFDLDLAHSSGQQLTCRIEAILRDDAPERGSSSDILFCEISTAGRWLLFPPMSASYVSAREGDNAGQIVVMVRGMLAGSQQWREIMTLSTGDDGAIDEWLDMLSATPEPPRLTKQPSFHAQREPFMMGSGLGDAASTYRPPSPSVVDVPIGEQATSAAQQWDDENNSMMGDLPHSSLRRAPAKKYRDRPLSPSTMTVTTDFTTSTQDTYEQVHARFNRIAERERYDDDSEYSSRSRYHERPRPKSSYIPQRSDYTGTTASTPRRDYSVWLPSTEQGSSDESASEGSPEHHYAQRPRTHRRTSSIPSTEPPTVNKLRKPSQPSTPRAETRRSEPSLPLQVQEPTSAPAKLQKRKPAPLKEDPKKFDVQQPQTPVQAKPTSLGLRSSILPSFTPAFLKRHRRSSSPLKHEYEPSTGSETLSSESDYSDVEGAESLTSESSADEDAAVSTVGELKDFRTRVPFHRPVSQPQPPKSDFSAAGQDSLGPSDSASQAPYRSVPQQPSQPSKMVAQIFSWSDRGAWDNMHPEECSIVVSPGLIEAFDLAQAANAPNAGAQGSPSMRGVKPLVALELTPLVPLRRGTALDISIRSPPTPNSVLRISNNIMFRSRSPEECEQLYYLINRARIDNPTYIALQNARGPVATSNWAEIMDKRNNERTNGNGGSSWLKSMSRRGSTYRSSKRSRTASVAATESSIGSTSSAFSALRRFNGGIFNIGKSNLTSKEGTRSTNSDSLSSGAATPLPIDPSMGTPVGVTNAKIRLYIRESASKWRDMGSARLTVMLPPRKDPNMPQSPKTTGQEKRILVCGKSKGETLIDATLPESRFERVARTGIAVSVWEDGSSVAPVGGVNSAKARVYMLQMKSVSFS